MKLAHFSVSSSGINIYANPGVAISPYGKFAASHYAVSEYLSPQKVQTSQTPLSESDIIVFMQKSIYEEAAKTYDINRFKCVIWDVADMGERLAAKGLSVNDVRAQNEEALKTYRYIREKVQALARDLTHVSWADIVNEENKPLGFRLPVSWANDYGLWRRGCHAIITTSDKKFIIEKRSKNIVFSPNKLDISLGGAVDDGETPGQAVMREIKEELGISVQRDWVHQIDLHKWNTYHPHYQKFTRCFLYTYHVNLPVKSPVMHPQLSEVAAVSLIGKRKLKTLLRLHRLPGFGTLEPAPKYFTRIVQLAEQGM